MELYTSMHKRSKCDFNFSTTTDEYHVNNITKSFNFPKFNLNMKKNHVSSTLTLDSLKQEILELQQELKNQFVTRGALEEMHCNSILHDSTHDSSISKPTKDLIKDVAILELEVLYLEKYLLSMYRKALNRRIESSSIMNPNPNPNPSLTNQTQMNPDFQTPKEPDPLECSMTRSSEPKKPEGNLYMDCGALLTAGLLSESTVQRSQSSLSRHSAIPMRTSPVGAAVAEAIDSYHSLPLSMLEGRSNGCVGISNQDEYRETPNTISEEMIKGISTIFFQLADPPLINHHHHQHGFPSSPASFSSSKSSPRDNWSPYYKQNTQKENIFFNEAFEEHPHLPFSTTAEILGIRSDAENLSKIECILRSYRGLVSALELVDPQKLRHEEKLSFWINIHNALVMHALLVYGVHQNNVKRNSMILKAAYNIGGHTVSVDMIQCSILACRLPRPGQWLQSLFSPLVKDKKKGFLKSYAMQHQEPRLHFALCSGSQSDPMVRLYTPKRVFQELELAKEEYIQTTISIMQKEMKLQLPKKVDTFVKDSNLSSDGVVELIDHCLPTSFRRFQKLQHMKFWKKILWVPHDFSFRYLIADELVG